jgi:hypothetical protein
MNIEIQKFYLENEMKINKLKSQLLKKKEWAFRDITDGLSDKYEREAIFIYHEIHPHIIKAKDIDKIKFLDVCIEMVEVIYEGLNREEKGDWIDMFKNIKSSEIEKYYFLNFTWYKQFKELHSFLELNGDCKLQEEKITPAHNKLLKEFYWEQRLILDKINRHNEKENNYINIKKEIKALTTLNKKLIEQYKDDIITI